VYFPYLVARGEEVNALIGLNNLGPNSKVLPILQAYSDDDDTKYSYTALIKACKHLVSKQNEFILIMDIDESIEDLQAISDFDSYCIRGYNRNQFDSIVFDDEVKYALLHEYPSAVVCDNPNIVYHIFMPNVIMFHTVMKLYPLEKVVPIADAFVKHEPNRDYPREDVFNTELPMTYQNEGYAGFGDFTVLPYNSSIGGQANANEITHVIHLTIFKDQDNMFYVDHYLTTPSEEPDNVRRSIKTIDKVLVNIGKYELTSGIAKISSLSGSSTSLGMYKRLGIMHHIELMVSKI